MVPWTVWFCALVLVGASALRAESFNFARVQQLARAAEKKPFQAPTNRVSQQLLQLTYNQYQAIGFRRGKALWANTDSPFQVEFFLPGSVHKDTVVIHEVTDGGVKPVPFSADDFDWGT